MLNRLQLNNGGVQVSKAEVSLVCCLAFTHAPSTAKLLTSWTHTDTLARLGDNGLEYW